MLKFLATTVAFMAFFFMTPQPAEAAEGCVIDVLGIRVCGTLVGQPLPEVVTVTADPIRIPGPTVTATVPGPVRTVTINPDPVVTTVTPPPVVRTQTIPGPTATVTVQVPGTSETITGTPVPGGTKTVTEPSAPQSAGPQNPAPTATVTATETETVSETTTRQADPERGTLGPDEDFFSLDIDPDDGDVTAGEAGLGVLALLTLIGLFFLGLYAGYYLGYRGKEQEDTKFMQALREQIMLRR